ncbi:tail protein: PROVISIONAL [Gigaspora margarita]|uniref:Tail protein: PROVISIONAL n=1 Tax=Gigaspora margarita TaxID=4874 RepID=A0A8H4B0S0_GIGMA|nr:tail protein: PROVISIONAL [Gigaspora margarita]
MSQRNQGALYFMNTIRVCLARSIDSNIEELLTKELDGFEKQLEECKTYLLQEKNNINKTIETQVGKEHKHLKDEYNALKIHLETNAKKDKEIRKLTSTNSQLKNDKKNIKKLAEQKYKELEDIIFVKDLKIITLNDQIISFLPGASRDSTIEPSSFNNFYKTKFWAGRHEDKKDNPNIQKNIHFELMSRIFFH